MQFTVTLIAAAATTIILAFLLLLFRYGCRCLRIMKFAHASITALGLLGTTRHMARTWLRSVSLTNTLRLDDASASLYFAIPTLVFDDNGIISFRGSIGDSTLRFDTRKTRRRLPHDGFLLGKRKEDKNKN